METDSERERLAAYLREHCGPHCYGEQDENGIDLSLIRENLKLTPLDRIRRGDAGETDLRLLLEIGKRHFESKIREDR